MQPDRRTDGPSRTAAELRSMHLWEFQFVRDVLVFAAVAGAIYAGYAMRTVTVPLLIALALAYLVEPVVSRMSRWRRMSRPLAVSVILGGLFLVLSAAIGVLVPLAVGQTLAFGESLRSGRYDGAIARVIEAVPDEYRSDVRLWTERILHPVPGAKEPAADAAEPKAAEPRVADGAPARTADAVEAKPQVAGSGVGIDPSILAILGAGTTHVYRFAAAVLQIGLLAFLIPFYFYYFSVHWPSIVAFFRGFVPDEKSDRVFTILEEMDRAVAGFVRGRIVICSVMGVLFAVGWQLCGVPYAIALGLMTGAFSIVPFLGGVGLPVAVGLLLADQFGLEEAERMGLASILLWPSIVFIIVQTIEGYLLTPVIAGKATNLDPVTIVVAILAGGSVAGVYGMLLAIPAAACGKIAAKRILLPRISAWARGSAPDPLPLDHG